MAWRRHCTVNGISARNCAKYGPMSYREMKNRFIDNFHHSSAPAATQVPASSSGSTQPTTASMMGTACCESSPMGKLHAGSTQSLAAAANSQPLCRDAVPLCQYKALINERGLSGRGGALSGGVVSGARRLEAARLLEDDTATSQPASSATGDGGDPERTSIQEAYTRFQETKLTLWSNMWWNVCEAEGDEFRGLEESGRDRRRAMSAPQFEADVVPLFARLFEQHPSDEQEDIDALSAAFEQWLSTGTVPGTD